jgi:O-glycosyl hydrolase
MKRGIALITFCLAFNIASIPQALNFSAVEAKVDFSRTLQDWDGFGFNYVETAHTSDMKIFNQEYGGFSLLDEKQKQEIIEMVFGKDGLKVGLVKMFLGALHQSEPGGPYDHRYTTGNMRYFVREGFKTARKEGRDLEIITTLYGPPGYTTRQKVHRGRDLDPAYKDAVADYMVDWVKFLKEEEHFPVKYLSLHNEGEDWSRWNQEGYTVHDGHDYNLYWPPGQVTEFVKRMPGKLEAAGVGDVGITPGETSNWYRFGTWGYVEAFLQDPEALEALDLITSHGFYNGNYGRWFGEHKSTGIDRLREEKPDLHAWVTSTSWSRMDAFFIKEMHGNIYTAKVNAIIPWAGIQRPPQWVGGDPNPGSAFTVDEDGSYRVRPGYYFYKQITRAGQPGMKVAEASAMDSETAVIAFASNGTVNPDAFIVTNISRWSRKIAVTVKGTGAKAFEAFRTSKSPDAEDSDQIDEKYIPLGEFSIEDGMVVFDSPAGSVTTFFANEIP